MLFRLLLPVFALLANTAHSQSFLEPGKPVSGTISPRKTDSFFVQLKAGQTATIRLSQRQVSLLAIVNDPLDSLQQVVDQNGIGHDEVISIDAALTGAYKIRVRWNYTKPLEGDYLVNLVSVVKTGTDAVAKAKQLFSSWYSPQAPGAAVVVIKNGKVVLRETKGLANLDQQIAFDPLSIFDVASVSKQFAGLAVAMLVDSGRLSMEDEIQRYIPLFPRYKDGPIKLGNLVYHTSGIRDWIDVMQLQGITPADATDHAMVMRIALQQENLLFTPGTQYRYCNTNYNLLAQVVSNVTGQPFSQWVDKNILQPLGMNHSFFKDDPSMVYPNRVLSYQPSGDHYRQRLLNTAAPGSSSFQTCLNDMEKWMLSFSTKQLITPGIDTLLSKPGLLANGQSTGYAFGNGISRFRGFDRIEHLGLHQGFRTSLVRFPAADLSLFYVSNDDDDASYGRATRLAELFLGLPPEKPKRGLPSVDRVLTDLNRRDTSTIGDDGAQYSGVYYAGEIASSFNVQVKNNRLVISHPRLDDIPLFRKSGDDFGFVLFKRNADQKISGMIIHGQEMYFRKID